MKRLDLKAVEHIAFAPAREIPALSEPIPDFSSRIPHRLESRLAVPFQTFGGKSPYTTLVEKAAILFYLMIKDRPFQNGNKRIAMTTLFVFLFLNGKWIEADPYELYKFTVWIADSPPKAKEGTVKAIQDFLKANLVTD